MADHALSALAVGAGAIGALAIGALAIGALSIGNLPIAVPTGVAIFPKDIVPAPREFAERFYNLQRRTEMPKGGHFAALKRPELLAENLRNFFRPLREK